MMIVYVFRTLPVNLVKGRFPVKAMLAYSKSMTPVTASFTENLSTSVTSPHKYLIPSDQLRITYSSSSGPGGQNVNKLATKVDVRY